MVGYSATLSYSKQQWGQQIAWLMVRYINIILVLLQVLDRGERIELLVDKTENLQFQVLQTIVYFFNSKWMIETLFVVAYENVRLYLL